MKLSDFDFDLPEQLIAERPVSPRSASRLLVADRGTLTDHHAHDLPKFLRPGDRLVLNDTRVLAARLNGARLRLSGQGPVTAKIEVTLLEAVGDGQWWALIKPLRKVSRGEIIRFSDQFTAELTAKSQGMARLKFNLTGSAFDAALAAVGKMPLPPYIAAKRPADDRDRTDYQTVWAKNAGAVAAPTASLHFDKMLLAALGNIGVSISKITLHVGAGTFLPVKVDDISQHKMHAERGGISRQAADEINATIAAGGRVIPVGTTALRLLETAATPAGHVQPWQGATDIFITPGFEFRIAHGLLTNFHLPKSTLMMLVSALMGTDRMREIYQHAIERKYRFFSYWDASFLLP